MSGEMTNQAIADRLLAFAGLLELNDASPFAARAYRRAAKQIRSAPTPVAALVRDGRVRQLRGIGPGIEGKLRELVETGEIAELRALQSELRPELVGLGRLLGLDARRMRELGRTLGVRNVDDLRAAVEEGRLSTVAGIGPKTERRVREALLRRPEAPRGLTLNRSLALTQTVADAFDGHIAGDARRCCELSFELAVVCAAVEPTPVLESFESHALIVTLLERTETNAVGLTVEGVPISLVVAEPDRLGTELIRATGSRACVASLGPLPDGPTEEAVFGCLGLPWRPPELREDPLLSQPDDLLEVSDLRGDLHCHTLWSDGRASVEEMAAAARDRGYDYLAICDHTTNVRVVPGLDDDAVRRQGEEIDRANEKLAPFRVLRGIECDIRPDGSLDLEDSTLAELDWVQISLHAGQRREGRELTRIVCHAMRHPSASALSHPKGRILNHRPENSLDLDAVFEVARETGVALETNGLPDRLDLSSAHAADALAAGVPLVLSSDAHSTAGLANIELAVGTVRRAGAGRGSVVNTQPLDELLARRGTGIAPPRSSTRKAPPR